MLNIHQLSFWEKQQYFEKIDFLIVGSGIVGNSAAYHLRQKYPNAKIVMIERGFLPSGASTKNAGFACFGSPTELYADYQTYGEGIFQTVLKRHEGLSYLKSIIGEEEMDFQPNGSWDLIAEKDVQTTKTIQDFLPYLNEKIAQVLGEEKVYTEDQAALQNFGFKGFNTAFKNRLEGQIDTGKMMVKFNHLLHQLGILQLNGIEVQAVHASDGILETHVGTLKAEHILICTNGFVRQLLPELQVEPARAQVVVTSPIADLKLKGTFHYDDGYYYFRNIQNRILLGGGRNLDFAGETTTEMTNTNQILEKLTTLLRTQIIPGQAFNIDYQWAGIMGIGGDKNPIIQKISDRSAIGVKMGGMGVAIGSLVGKELADLF